MKRIQQIVLCFLALCLASGGAIGLSPVLHRLVEHGGLGAAHIHGGSMPGAATHTHLRPDGDDPRHIHLPERLRPARLFEHSYEPFRLPKFPLTWLWRNVSRLIATETSSPPSSSKDSPRHEHHSLFQLLATGLVDQPIELPLLLSVPTVPILNEFPATTRFVARDWDAQTATRGPPSVRS
jgi:hypothetical protein